jgi:hypothetical protein
MLRLEWYKVVGEQSRVEKKYSFGLSRRVVY